MNDISHEIGKNEIGKFGPMLESTTHPNFRWSNHFECLISDVYVVFIIYHFAAGIMHFPSKAGIWFCSLETGRSHNFHFFDMFWAKSHNAVNCNFGKVLLETWIIAVTPCCHNLISIGWTHVGWNKEPRITAKSDFWKYQNDFLKYIS